MSHGGGESGRLHDKAGHSGKRKSRVSGDEFARAIAKIAVAQLCETVGYQSFQQSALEKLSDVTTWYIRNMGKTAQFYANLAGRTEGNVFDVIQGMEELGLSQGFAGASDVDHCLASSVARERKPVQTFFHICEESPAEHIPAWLPAFPDPQTCVQLSAGNEGDAVFNADKIEPARHHLKMDIARATQGTESNPFLAAPLQFGEKEVSHLVPPVRLSEEEAVRYPVEQNHIMDNHMSVLETFAPAIEAMKSRFCDSEEGQKKVLLNQRPAVQFKIRVGKNSMAGAPDLSPQKIGIENISEWFGKDSENDDKKRRAEKILKQSIENPSELAQL
ncbi:BROMODOMAIN TRANSCRIPTION FACTOR [Salix purpurea]|uniref:BROMODOMAIN TRANSCRIPTION FACTOR n=1 Tax=Salix purpurea TaxID=77065 RepID=A0A9Q0URI7_SALPP|nr:BROMODOMAIN TRANSCRIPTION FACTOR [Salix purpurea]